MSFVFLRCIIRSLILDLNLIYVNEIGFLLENNNYYIWRNPVEEITGRSKIERKERLNLIIGVSKRKVIAKKILYALFDTEIFIDFLDYILKIYLKKKSKNLL